MKADNKKIWIRGQFVEVTDEVYGKYIICNCRNRGKGSRSVKTLCLQISSSDE